MPPKLFPARFYEKMPDRSARCRLCAHFCRIPDGFTGICGARLNRGGELFSLVYGRPRALNADPIEKKPLFHFLPGSLAFSIGTFGCNFKCANCLNYGISQVLDLKKHAAGNSVAAAEIIRLARESGCASIAYTYNEPTIFTEYALDIMKLARQAGLKNVWVSNGFMSPDCLEAIIPYLDAANIDLKSMDDEFYKNTCRARVRPVLENLQTLKKAGVHLEITTLLIPGLSDGPKMLKQLAEFIRKKLSAHTPWHLSVFSPEISWQLGDLPKTDTKSVDAAYKIGQKAGLEFIYVGNIFNDDRENTYCPECRELIVKRTGYNIERRDQNGACPGCRKKIKIIL
jgi:pyruvate formate lyase activating enzyme